MQVPLRIKKKKKSHNHKDDKTPRAASVPYLGGHVEHHGYHGRVHVAVDDEAHLLEPLAEIDGVLGQLSHSVAAFGTKRGANTDSCAQFYYKDDPVSIDVQVSRGELLL